MDYQQKALRGKWARLNIPFPFSKMLLHTLPQYSLASGSWCMLESPKNAFEMFVKPIQKLIKQKGFDSPTEPQEETIPKILAGKNCRARGICLRHRQQCTGVYSGRELSCFGLCRIRHPVESDT